MYYSILYPLKASKRQSVKAFIIRKYLFWK